MKTPNEILSEILVGKRFMKGQFGSQDGCDGEIITSDNIIDCSIRLTL